METWRQSSVQNTSGTLGPASWKETTTLSHPQRALFAGGDVHMQCGIGMLSLRFDRMSDTDHFLN